MDFARRATWTDTSGITHVVRWNGVHITYGWYVLCDCYYWITSQHDHPAVKDQTPTCVRCIGVS